MSGKLPIRYFLAEASSASDTGSIQGPELGLITTFTFTSVESLTGGTAADAFVFSNGASTSGSIDGGGGSDTLDFGDQGNGDNHRHTAHRLQSRHHRCHRPIWDQLADQLGQCIASFLGVLHRMHIILEHDPLRRMVKAQRRQPVSVCPRPRFATVHKAVPQQEAE